LAFRSVYWRDGWGGVGGTAWSCACRYFGQPEYLDTLEKREAAFLLVGVVATDPSGWSIDNALFAKLPVHGQRLTSVGTLSDTYSRFELAALSRLQLKAPGLCRGILTGPACDWVWHLSLILLAPLHPIGDGLRLAGLLAFQACLHCLPS
jgi:hypothetical protein